VGSLCRYNQIMGYIAVRNFVNGLDVIVSLSTGSGKLNDSKVAPVSLSRTEVFLLGNFFLWGSEPPKNEMSRYSDIVCQNSSCNIMY